MFHVIPCNCSCHRNWRTPCFMEFHGIASVIEIGVPQVPWNTMESHGTACVIETDALQAPWNSMEYQRTARVSEIGAFQVPWNSRTFCCLMEPLVSSILWVLNLDLIPWNSSFQISMTIILSFVGWIHFCKLISTLYIFLSLFHQLMFYYQYLHYTTCISCITHCVSKYHSKSLFNVHKLILIKKMSWNFPQSSLDLFEHLNTYGSMQFHGT